MNYLDIKRNNFSISLKVLMLDLQTFAYFSMNVNTLMHCFNRTESLACTGLRVSGVCLQEICCSRLARVDYF